MDSVKLLVDHGISTVYALSIPLYGFPAERVYDETWLASEAFNSIVWILYSQNMRLPYAW